MIRAGGPGDGVTGDQAGDCADDADGEALQHKNVADLRAVRAKRHEDGNVSRAVGDAHGQDDQNVQAGDERNQADEQRGD